MKTRLVRTGTETLLLCSNGTICKATPALITALFLQFEQPEQFTGQAGMWTDCVLDMSDYPGETLAFVTDFNCLVAESPWMTETVLNHAIVRPKELTVVEYAEKHHCTKWMIKSLLRQGRIPEAIMRGRQWFIPENTPYPIDEKSRKPSGGRTQHKEPEEKSDTSEVVG